MQREASHRNQPGKFKFCKSSDNKHVQSKAMCMASLYIKLIVKIKIRWQVHESDTALYSSIALHLCTLGMYSLTTISITSLPDKN